MHAKDWLCIGSCFLLGACSVSGDDAASRWVQSRTPLVPPANSSVVPTLVDTPPAVYTAKHVVDPFAPGRIGQPFTSGTIVKPLSRSVGILQMHLLIRFES